MDLNTEFQLQFEILAVKHPETNNSTLIHRKQGGEMTTFLYATENLTAKTTILGHL